MSINRKLQPLLVLSKDSVQLIAQDSDYAVYAEISLNTGDAKNFADAASMASWATDAIDVLS